MMTQHDETLTREEIRSALRGNPITADELATVEDPAERLGLALVFGTADLRAVALRELARQIYDELSDDERSMLHRDEPSNVVPFKPRIDGRDYVTEGPQGYLTVDYDGLGAAANGQPRAPADLKRIEAFWLKRAADNSTALLQLRGQIAEAERMRAAIDEMLTTVRAEKARTRTNRRGAPTSIRVIDDGDNFDGPPAAA